jgi:hypothetical protein
MPEQIQTEGSLGGGGGPDGSLKQQLRQWWELLRTDRSSWLSRWSEIADQIRPWGYRTYSTDTNKGTDKFGSIVNNTPIEAARTLAAGMMSGITSSSRPWFRLTVRGDADINEVPDVREWLGKTADVLRLTMLKSNVYKGLHLTYADIGTFCTSAMLIEEDDEDDVRCYHFPVGSYALSCSPRGDVDTLFRQVTLTVSQVVKQFGLAKCSDLVKQQFQARQYTTRVNVLHAVFPNEKYKKGKAGPAGKKFLSYWWEESSGGDGFLRESGYEEWPVQAPRWEVTGEDTYGHGPGFAALGDCKALQLYERRSAQAVDKVVNPPMQAPTSARNGPLSLLPGDLNFVDALGAGQAMRPALEVNHGVVETLEMKIQRHENRIRKAFFADLWLLLSESDGQMTATEVQERRQEKLLQLGTVLEALEDELLDPLINRVYAILLRKGRIPPPPEALQGSTLKVEYTSIMAQAQKLLATTGLERVATFVGNLARVNPDSVDKLDWDKLVEEYADALGVPPSVVRVEDIVEQMRAARAKHLQQQQQMAQIQQGAETAKTLADTQLENPSALQTMLQGVSAR